MKSKLYMKRQISAYLIEGLGYNSQEMVVVFP